MARPRDPDLDRRIMRATAELLAEGGYDAVTMEAVAARAGVGKPSVYRRWRNRAHLVFEVQTVISVPTPLPDTGSFRDDLFAVTAALAQSLHEARRDVVGDQLGQMIADEAFARMVWDRRLGPNLDGVVPIWHRAVARGQVRSDLDGAEVMSDLAGSLVYRILVLHQIPDDSMIERIVDLVVRAVSAQPDAPAPRRRPRARQTRSST